MPKEVKLENVEIYFQDEARIGQQGSTTRIWTKKGTRPRVVRQRQFLSANIFGAVCPSRDFAFALVLPNKDTDMMQLFLDELSKNVSYNNHAVLITDQASWHKTKNLNLPKNISFLFLPPYAPELNSIEQLWLQLRQRWLSNRCFKNYDDIVNSIITAWKNFTGVVGAIKNLCSRSWAILAH